MLTKAITDIHTGIVSGRTPPDHQHQKQHEERTYETQRQNNAT
jgi:hypothetical protein